MKKYFYISVNEKIGPLSEEELLELDLPKETKVWRDGLADWMAFSNLEEFKRKFDLPPPPLPSKNSFSKSANGFFINILICIPIVILLSALFYQIFIKVNMPDEYRNNSESKISVNDTFFGSSVSGVPHTKYAKDIPLGMVNQAKEIIIRRLKDDAKGKSMVIALVLGCFALFICFLRGVRVYHGD